MTLRVCLSAPVGAPVAALTAAGAADADVSAADADADAMLSGAAVVPYPGGPRPRRPDFLPLSPCHSAGPATPTTPAATPADLTEDGPSGGDTGATTLLSRHGSDIFSFYRHICFLFILLLFIVLT